MSAEAPSVEGVRLGSAEVAGIWARHLTSLLLPSNALVFLFTGPHPWYLAPLFMLPVVLAFVVDDSDRVEPRQPRDLLPAWPDAAADLRREQSPGRTAALLHRQCEERARRGVAGTQRRGPGSREPDPVPVDRA